MAGFDPKRTFRVCPKLTPDNLSPSAVGRGESQGHAVVFAWTSLFEAVGKGHPVSVEGRWWKLAFWGGIIASFVWLAVTIFSGAVAIRQVMEGSLPFGWNIFTAMSSVGVILPLIVAALLAWAVRLRKSGSPLRITLRAFAPLLAVPLIYADTGILLASVKYREYRLHTGSISYVCGLDGFSTDVIGGRELILTEHRHLRAPSRWEATRPGNGPMRTTAFPYFTGGDGGSVGIKWQEGGRTMTALLSFSDAIIEHWRDQVWAILVEGDASEKRGDLSGMKTMHLACNPDPGSYRR